MHEKSRDPTIYERKEIQPQNERMKTQSYNPANLNLVNQHELQTFHINNKRINKELVRNFLRPCQSQNQHLNPCKTDAESDQLDLISVFTTRIHNNVLL